MPSASGRTRLTLTGALVLVLACSACLFVVILASASAVAPGGARVTFAICGGVLCAATAAAAGFVLVSLKRLLRRADQLLATVEVGRGRSGREGAPDELQALTSRLNRAINTLRDVDRLRGRRVALAFRLVHLLHQRLNAPSILVDLRTNTFCLNERFRLLFGTEQDTLNADAILSMRVNAAFRDLYHRAIFALGRTETAEVELRLPHGPGHRMAVEVIPVRGDDDRVSRAVILLGSPAPERPVSPPPGQDRAGKT